MNPRAGEVHQDWTPVVLYNPNATNKGKSETPQQNPTMTNKMRALDGDEIVAPPEGQSRSEKSNAASKIDREKKSETTGVGYGGSSTTYYGLRKRKGGSQQCLSCEA